MCTQDSKAVFRLVTASAQLLIRWHSCMLCSTLWECLSSCTDQSNFSITSVIYFWPPAATAFNSLDAKLAWGKADVALVQTLTVSKQGMTTLEDGIVVDVTDVIWCSLACATAAAWFVTAQNQMFEISILVFTVSDCVSVNTTSEEL